MDGLRRFIQAVRWTWVICVKATDRLRSRSHSSVSPSQRRPSGKGADELTLRADEVGTQRAFINAGHIEFERWGPPLVDVDSHAFCQAIHKGIEGKELEELYFHFREMNLATGAKKPSESQKSESALGSESGLGQESGML